jgi:hypothetical protein
MHWSHGKSPEPKHAPLVVRIDRGADGLAAKKCAAFGDGNPKRPCKARGIDRFALRQFTIEGDSGPLLIQREAAQVRFKRFPISVEGEELGHESDFCAFTASGSSGLPHRAQ